MEKKYNERTKCFCHRLEDNYFYALKHNLL